MIVFSAFTEHPKVLLISSTQVGLMMENGVMNPHDGHEIHVTRKGEIRVQFASLEKAWEAAETLLWEQEIEIGSLRTLVEKSLLLRLDHLHDFGESGCKNCRRSNDYLTQPLKMKKCFLPCVKAQDFMVQEILGKYLFQTYGEEANFSTEASDEV